MWKNQYLFAIALCAGALSTLGMGCELIATVDRSRIPGDDGVTDGCADGTKNGDETDIDCGGSTCPQCELAKACTAKEDCASGFCADGVCCNTACDAECDACTADLKESGEEDGSCGASKAESECGEATCSEGVQTARGTCDGTSVDCAPGEETSCETFACDPDENACFAECSEDTQCAKCHVCDAGEGTCSLAPAGATGLGCEDDQACDAAGECKAANGQECTDATDCGSGSCVDGVCCDTACDSPCQACNIEGSAGKCSNVPLGAEDGMDCSDVNVCDGEGACKLVEGERCTTDEQCASGNCITVVSDVKACDEIETPDP
ncbi:hypothetical protein WMF26_03015 [Sorangium sp. So ce185]|uniref:hypothetical protein n=1 Tax=Sorangium sp. So ce185 TaxID=3133287 RepID=UPI003F5EE39D